MHTTRPIEEQPPTAEPRQVARYVLLRKIGEGGHGQVFRAYDPALDRLTAVKLLRGGGHNAALLREARILAKLSHPNVVAAYDAGVHDGQAFLTLELVDGSHLGSRASGPIGGRALVRALGAAARGLAEAHRQKIVHGDIKPSNLLVGPDGRIRITDFGVARLLDDDDAMLGGTTAYLAPEQHDGAGATFASDQYSFALTMWEALAGGYPWPFPTASAGASTSSTTHRHLLARKHEGVPSWSRTSGIPRRIARVLQRAMQPVPEDRWPSMEAFADALEVARRPSARAIVLGLVGVLVLAAAAREGSVAIEHELTTTACEQEGRTLQSTWTPERADAIAAAFDSTGLAYAADSWQRARARIDLFATTWQQTRSEACVRGERDHLWEPETLARSRTCLDELQVRLDTLVTQWMQPGPSSVDRAAPIAWDLPAPQRCLDEPTLEQQRDTGDDPDGARDLYLRLAEAAALRSTGRYDEASRVVAEVLDVARERGQWLTSARAEFERASVEHAQGHYADARHGFEDAIAIAERHGDDRLALDAADELISLVGVSLEEYDEALRWFWFAERKRERLGLGSDHPSVGSSLGRVAVVHLRRGSHDEARTTHERALAIREASFGPDHPAVAYSLNGLGNVLHLLGRYDEAFARYGRALAILEAALGPEHPELAPVLDNLGWAYDQRGRYDAALSSYQRALELRKAALGPTHPDVATSFNNIGTIHQVERRHDEALRYHAQALAIREAAFGPKHPRLADSLDNIGLAYDGLQRYDEAITSYQRSLAIREGSQGAEHPKVADTLVNIGSLHQLVGRYEAAEAAFERALSIRERVFGPDHPETIEGLNTIAATRAARGQLDEASSLYERVLAAYRRTPGHDYEIAGVLNGIANLHVARKRDDRAVPLYLEALARLDGAEGTHPAERVMLLVNVGAARARLGHRSEARADHRRALELAEAAFGDDDPIVAQTLRDLADTHMVLDEPSRAISLYERAIEILHVGEARADVRLRLAMAMGRNPRGLALARQAWAEAPIRSAVRNEIEAWLCAAGPRACPR